jgi:ABC-type uncharacterized transport system YnjBCD ATPase subunit/lipopolysaccharide export system protein LptA
MLGARAALMVATAALATASTVAAQTGECTMRQEEFGRLSQEIVNGEEIMLLHDPFVVLCPDGEELRANSGRINRTLRDIYLYGDVFFQDSVQTLTANEATYNPGTARLWARGNVVYTDRREGSTLRGPELEYLRATESRPIAQMTATQRPTLMMAATEGAESSEPLELTSERIEMAGEDELSAFGEVVITRTDLRATSGEARYNSATEELSLQIGAVVLSGEFELVGDSVDARLVEGAIEFLHSRRDAGLRGEDLRVTGDDLQLHFRDDLLQRAVAKAPPEGGSRALAISATFQVEADSLDALFVDQRLEEVYAIGDAFGETIDTTAIAPSTGDSVAVAPDTTEARPDILERDWIRGDTIVGYFAAVESMEPAAVDAGAEPGQAPLNEAAEIRDAAEIGEPVDLEGPAGPDSIDAEQPLPLEGPLVAEGPDGAEAREDPRQSVELRRLVARGSAQSLYRITPEDSEGNQDRRNVNFLVGRQIVLDVAEGLVKIYRKRRVVNDVAVRVSQGEIVGLLGPNGAGKTTTFYMMVGLIAPDAGRVFVDEEDLTGVPMYLRARKGVGYLAQEPSVFRKLTVEENVLAVLQMLGISAPEQRRAARGAARRARHQAPAHSKAYALSGGERRRLEDHRGPWSVSRSSCCWMSRSRVWIRSLFTTSSRSSRIFGAGTSVS